MDGIESPSNPIVMFYSIGLSHDFTKVGVRPKISSCDLRFCHDRSKPLC